MSRHVHHSCVLALVAVALAGCNGAQTDAVHDSAHTSDSLSLRAPENTPHRSPTSNRLPIGSDLRLSRELLSGAGRITVRDQWHDGLRVIGSGTSQHYGPGDSRGREHVRVATNLPRVGVPAITESRAVELVNGLRKARVSSRPSRVERVIVPHDDLGGRQAYFVDMQMGTPKATRYVIDAETGRLLGRSPLVFHAKGKVFKLDPAPLPDTVDLTHLDGSGTLTGRMGSTANFVRYSEDGVTMFGDSPAKGDKDGNFLFEPTTGADTKDAFSQVNAYYHANEMDTFFRETLGLPMGYGLQILTNVTEPDGAPMDNAFAGENPGGATKNVIGMGQGPEVDFAYVGDVVAHEFGHYVFHNAAAFETDTQWDQYGLDMMPWSLHEGLADYFAASRSGRPLMGEAALKEYARDVSKSPGRCPDNLVGEPHADGLFVGHAAWKVRETVGKEVADRAVWSAVAALPKGASIGDFAVALERALDAELAGKKISTAQRDEISKAFGSLGISTCGRYAEVSTKSPQTSTFVGFGVYVSMMGSSCKEMAAVGNQPGIVQYTYKAPSAGTEATFELSFAKTDPFKGQFPDLNAELGYDYDIAIRKGQPVTYDIADDQAFQWKIVGADKILTGVKTEVTEFTLGSNGQLALEPGAQYYFAVLSRNCTTALGTLRVKDDAPDAGSPDARVAPNTTSDSGVAPGQGDVDGGKTGPASGGGAAPSASVGGGGCQLSPTDQSALPGSLLLALALAWARGRRRERGTP